MITRAVDAGGAACATWCQSASVPAAPPTPTPTSKPNVASSALAADRLGPGGTDIDAGATDSRRAAVATDSRRAAGRGRSAGSDRRGRRGGGGSSASRPGRTWVGASSSGSSAGTMGSGRTAVGGSVARPSPGWAAGPRAGLSGSGRGLEYGEEPWGFVGLCAFTLSLVAGTPARAVVPGTPGTGALFLTGGRGLHHLAFDNQGR